MRFSILAFVIAPAMLVSASSELSNFACIGPTHKIKPAFNSAKLVPPTVPTVGDDTYLAVQYNASAVNLGNFFNQSDVSAVPDIYFAADLTKNYTLIMIDPDVPQQYGPQLRHWVVSDLKPSCSQSVIVGGTMQSAYIGPGPIGDLPFHRYVLYLFIQPSTATFPVPDQNVTNFVIQDYIKTVGLQGPISSNFYKVTDNGQNE